MHKLPDGQAGESPERGGEDRWVVLVTGLKSMLPHMQAEFVRRVQEIAEYSEQAVDTVDLEQSAFDSISRIVDAMSGSQHYPRMLRFGTDLGTRRARQGLSADALMSAVRLDFPVIWSALLTEAEPGDEQLLAHRVEEVWRVVDDYAEATRTSFVETRVRMAREEAGVRLEFISALFGAQGRLAETRERFAKAFSVDPEAPYVVVAANGPGAAQLRQLTFFPEKSRQIFVHEGEDYTYAFWPSAGPDAQQRQPDGLKSAACGLARAEDGLTGLASAARVAAALSELPRSAAAGPKTVEFDWPQLARTRMDSIGVELGTELESRLAIARLNEAERLHETIICFLANGSISETATALFCHRNTILNRLRRFKEVTGLDPSIPLHAARIVIAWS